MKQKKYRLLSICSSRTYPKRLREMLKSWKRTRTKGLSRILIYIWDEDPKIEEYKKIIKEFNDEDIEFILGKSRFMTEVLNYISTEVYPDYDYYQNINDDHYYVVKGWDKMMIDPLDKNGGWGISYCKGKNDAHNPNAEIISGKIVRALGYYYYPKFRQFGIEGFVISLGQACGFFLVSEVIEHRCINIGYGEKDETWKFIYSPSEALHARSASQEWKSKMDGELKKIRDIIATEMKEDFKKGGIEYR